MTNIILNTKIDCKNEILNYAQNKLKSLIKKHPFILKNDLYIELNDGSDLKKDCCIKLKSQQANFVVTSSKSDFKEAIAECIIILNYQLVVMS